MEDVGAGGLVYAPRGVAHTYEVLGERAGRHYVLSMPGNFDGFFARAPKSSLSRPTGLRPASGHQRRVRD